MIAIILPHAKCGNWYHLRSNELTQDKVCDSFQFTWLYKNIGKLAVVGAEVSHPWISTTSPRSLGASHGRWPASMQYVSPED
jgi:hypothetical protein